MYLQKGDIPPPTVLPVTSQAMMEAGEGPQTFKLESHKGEKNVVLYFYPKDDTPGCTQEGNEFTAQLEAFEKLDTVIIGVSRDSIAKHEKFIKKYNLGVLLGSDEAGTVTTQWKVWVEKSMYGRSYHGIRRDTYLINKKGKIARMWTDVKVPGHVEEVLKEVQAATEGSA